MQRGHLSSIREAMDPCSCSPSDRGCAETRKRSVDAGSKKGDCETGNSALRNTGRFASWPRDLLAAFVPMNDVSCHIGNASKEQKAAAGAVLFLSSTVPSEQGGAEAFSVGAALSLLRCTRRRAASWKCRRRPAQCSGRKRQGSVTLFAYSAAGEARLVGSDQRIA